MLDIKYEEYGIYAEISLSGSFDIQTSQELKELVFKGLKYDEFHIDLTDVETLDSSGMAALIQIKKQKKLKILGVSEYVERVLTSASLLQFFDIKL